MSLPTIADAKDVATRHRRQGVVILSFDAVSYHAASYGHTRQTCNAMRAVVDQIGELIESGDIVIGAGLGGERIAEPGEINAELLAAAQDALEVFKGIAPDCFTIEAAQALVRLQDVLAQAKGAQPQ